MALAMIAGDDTEIKVTPTGGLGKAKSRRKFSSDLGKMLSACESKIEC